MSVFRVEKVKNYTVMSNYHLKDKKLSFKAKGLLSYMLSLPNEWDYSLAGLCKASKDSKTSVQSALKELRENSYLKTTRERTENGRFAWIYNIYEQPSPYTDFPSMVNPSMENQPQLNTNIVNTKKRKNKKKSFQQNYIQSIPPEYNELYEN